MLSFCDDVDRYLRDMHIPDATQHVTKAGVRFGYLVIDRGTVMLADLEGPAREIAETCVECLVHSAEINMIDWQRRLFRHFCHVTMDLDPSTQDLVVEPYEGMYDELEQAIHEHHASILIVETVRAYRARKRAATMMQAIVRGFLRRPVDLTGEC